MFSIIDDMSRGIVSQKPFTNKKRKSPLKKMLTRSWVQVPEFKISQKIKNIISRWMCFIVVIILWIIILVKTIFFKPEQNIVKIKISEDTLATYQDIELFNMISNEVKGQNFFVLASKKDELLTKIQKKFPFVWKIELQLEPENTASQIEWTKEFKIWVIMPETLSWNNTWFQIYSTLFPLKDSQQPEEIWWTLWVQLQYYEPLLLVRLNDKNFAIWDEQTFVELREWMLLWIRTPTEDDPNPEQLFVIETPKYLEWTNSLDWFFFEFSLNDFLTMIPLAKEAFPTMKRFVYLAWSRRIAIFTSDDKTLYFNFPETEDITEARNYQIQKYNTLVDYYPNFHKIQNIDLWALDEKKVIIRK